MRLRIICWTTTVPGRWHLTIEYFRFTFAQTQELDIVHNAAQAYAERHTSPDEPLLAELEEWTVKEHAEPHMISGRLQGQLIGQLSRMVAPERILEIGTFVGYSALCLARGLRSGGRLYTLELREEDARLARSWFDRSPLGHLIECIQGDALMLIETLDETWDLVFLDADKVNYTRYYEAVMPRLRPGGWIIADNVLFHGQVLEPEVKGKSAKAIEAFNRHVSQDPRVETVMLTVRDGLMIIRKK